MVKNICSKQKLCKNENCMECFNKSFANHPKSKYWSDKNELTPRDVFKNSNKKYWFNCDKCSHMFESSLGHISNGKWCPYCPNQRMCKNNCIECFNKSFANHSKAKYWSDKNKLTPRDVFKNSNKKYWFNCDKCSHTFESILSDITKGKWCPFCTNKKLCNDENCIECYEKSFTNHPKAKYWSDKNKLTPRDVFKVSGKKYWFNCDKCSHNFESSLSHITNGTWCPFCSNPPKELCNDEKCIQCYEKSFTNHPKAKYWSDKNELKPRDVFKSSGEKFWFNCDKCSHIFEKSLDNITNGSWCPYCSNPPKELCNDEKCIECYEKSFANYPKSKYWSDKNELTPRDVFKHSKQKYWFHCDKCSHTFESVISSITNGNWCPYCSNQKLCKDDCIECYEKSFANHPKSKYWSVKNKLTPRDVFGGSDKKYWFNCDKCSHTFESILNNIAKTDGTWCSYCSNQKLCKDDCIECYEKSFANHPKSKYWSVKNELTPRDVFRYANQKYWFNCEKNHTFESCLCNITKTNGTWCPHCTNKTETIIYEKLIELYGEENIQRQRRIENYRFDFTLHSKVNIEVDGPQHFEQVSNWSSPEYTIQKDILKMTLDKKHMIRIHQEDIFYNKINWEQFIKSSLDMIENIQFNKPVFFIHFSRQELYQMHISQIEKVYDIIVV